MGVYVRGCSIISIPHQSKKIQNLGYLPRYITPINPSARPPPSPSLPPHPSILILILIQRNNRLNKLLHGRQDFVIHVKIVVSHFLVEDHVAVG